MCVISQLSIIRYETKETIWKKYKSKKSHDKKSKWKIIEHGRADYVCDFPLIHQIRAAWLPAPSLAITGGSNGETLSSLSSISSGFKGGYNLVRRNEGHSHWIICSPKCYPFWCHWYSKGLMSDQILATTRFHANQWFADYSDCDHISDDQIWWSTDYQWRLTLTPITRHPVIKPDSLLIKRNSVFFSQHFSLCAVFANNWGLYFAGGD